VNCMRIIILFLSFLLFSNCLFAADDEDGEAAPVIEYLEIAPKFTVNLKKPRKYLQVNVQLMLEGAKTIEKVKKHLPALRHELIMTYSGRPAAELQTMEQREALRQETKDVITKVLETYKIDKGFKDVFFTEFLVQ